MAMAATVNASFTSPVANADYSATANVNAGGVFARVYDGMNGFTVFASLLLCLIAYDQCKLARRSNADNANPLNLELELN